MFNIIKKITLLLALSQFAISSVIAVEYDLGMILKKADSYRGFDGEGFSIELKLLGIEKKKKFNYSITNKVKETNSLVLFNQPALMKGRALLQKDNNMWYFFPSTKKVIRISAAQRLVGNAGNGDIAGIRLSEDYDSKVIKEDIIDDKEVLVIELTSNQKKKAYPKIIVSLDKKSYQLVSSEHYAISGKLMKTVQYKEYKKFDGRLLLSKMLIISDISKDDYTWLLFEKYIPEKISDNIFSKEYLERL